MRVRPLLASLSTGALVAATTLVVAADASAVQPRVAVASATSVPASARPVGHSITTTFDVALASRDQVGLDAFLKDLYTPGSPRYRQFLTPAQFGARYGATPSAIKQVRAYFASQGISTLHVSAGRSIVRMRGTTTAIARALAAPVEAVRLANGSVANALDATGTLPSNIAADVTSIAGLSATYATAMNTLTSSAAQAHVSGPTTCPSAGDSTTNGPNSLYGYTAQQQGQLYGLSSEWAAGNTGVGQTIAIFELGRYSTTDVSTYFSCYGVNPALSAVNVDGGPTGSISDEATLDIEEAGVLAPGASLVVYQGPNSSSGPIDTYTQIADDNTASIVSTSWGTCELDPQGDSTAEHTVFEQMAAQGQTVLAAAGDSGSADCYGATSSQVQLAVDDPASQPFVTGVGGLSVTSINPLNQTVWMHQSSSSSCDSSGGGGGGQSALWSRPSWQQGSGITASDTMRMVPDLSVMGDPATGFIQYFPNSGTCATPAWYTVGGTSIGSPLMSAVIAVAAQSCQVTRIGFLNPTLYNMPSSDFVDVTTGSNDVYGAGGYSAGVGYDMASGLGSPNGTAFIQGLCPATVDLSHSTFGVSPSAPLAMSGHATVSAHLVDQNGSSLTNAILGVTATSSTGELIIDGDPTSRQGVGSATYHVTSSATGDATFELVSSAVGTVNVSVTYQGSTIYTTTIDFVARTPHPATPRIAKVTPLSGAARVVIAKPSAAQLKLITHYQYSLNAGRTWRSMRAGTLSAIIASLAHAHSYRIVVRAVGAGGNSGASKAVTFTTR